MSKTTDLPAVGLFVGETVRNVFTTMLGLPVEIAAAQRDEDAERVSGGIGLAGASLSGSLYLHLTEAFARQAAVAMLGMNGKELGDEEVNDVVGELTNMVAGGLKSHFCDLGWPCTASTPTIIRGTQYQIEAALDVYCEQLAFTCQGHSLVVEVHLKLN